jgi:hypothetical protein
MAFKILVFVVSLISAIAGRMLMHLLISTLPGLNTAVSLTIGWIIIAAVIMNVAERFRRWF